MSEVNSSNSISSFVTRSKQPKNKSVQFADVHVREHKLCLGDHPSCSTGPPLSMDWDYTDLNSHTVDDYETSRGKYRPDWNMLVMNELRRESILKNHARVTDEDMQNAIYEIRKIQRQRLETLKRDGAIVEIKTGPRTVFNKILNAFKA